MSKYLGILVADLLAGWVLSGKLNYTMPMLNFLKVQKMRLVLQVCGQKWSVMALTNTLCQAWVSQSITLSGIISLVCTFTAATVIFLFPFCPLEKNKSLTLPCTPWPKVQVSGTVFLIWAAQINLWLKVLFPSSINLLTTGRLWWSPRIHRTLVPYCMWWGSRFECIWKCLLKLLLMIYNMYI